MAWRFPPPLQPSLLTKIIVKPQFLPIFLSPKSSSQKHIKLHLPNTVIIPFAKSNFRRRPISFLAMAQQQSSSFSSSSSQRHRHTNRLASEHSPYLLQHAHNPVDWYPWGEEAFAEARRRDVPIFLSIGYSTCHWCHVMEVESFENEEVAKLLNDWFVSIKVDREERPDVDKVYMTYVQALYGGGGWPLSAFLSPDLKPLMGGTYFPPEDKYGRPGFKTILRKVKEAWNSKRDMLVQSGAFAIEQLSEALAATSMSNKLPDEVLQTAVRKCADHVRFSADLLLRRLCMLRQPGVELVVIKTTFDASEKPANFSCLFSTAAIPIIPIISNTSEFFSFFMIYILAFFSINLRMLSLSDLIIWHLSMFLRSDYLNAGLTD